MSYGTKSSGHLGTSSFKNMRRFTLQRKARAAAELNGGPSKSSSQLIYMTECQRNLRVSRDRLNSCLQVNNLCIQQGSPKRERLGFKRVCLQKKQEELLWRKQISRTQSNFVGISEIKPKSST